MPPTPDLARLAALASDPDAQAAYALTLLTPTAGRATHDAALNVLRKVAILRESLALFDLGPAGGELTRRLAKRAGTQRP